MSLWLLAVVPCMCPCPAQYLGGVAWLLPAGSQQPQWWLLWQGGLALYQHGQVTSGVDSRISDAQLAQEVSQLSQGQEDPTTQPLQELFE